MKARLAERLRSIMRDQVAFGTQQAISSRCGMSQSTLSRILNEEQSATLDALEQLASGLGFKRPEALFLRKDEIELLAAWGKLGDEERRRILGYIEINAQMQALPATAKISRSERLQENERVAQQDAAQYSAPDLNLQKNVAPSERKARPGRPPKRS